MNGKETLSKSDRTVAAHLASPQEKKVHFFWRRKILTIWLRWMRFVWAIVGWAWKYILILGSAVKMTWNAFSMSLFFTTSSVFSSSSSSFRFCWSTLANNKHAPNQSASLFHTLNHFNNFCMSIFSRYFFIETRTTFFNRLISVLFLTTHRFHVKRRSMPIDTT